MKDNDYSESEKLLNFIPFKFNPKLKSKEKEFYQSLLQYGGNRFDLLPEVGKVLDLKDLLKFLYVFSGKTISVPEKRAIYICLRDLDVYYSYELNRNNIEVNKLAKKYNTSIQNIFSIISKVGKTLNKPLI